MKATLIEKKEVAKDTVWFKFELEKAIQFKPGQIFYISIEKLNYHDELSNTRHFSIVNSPNDNKFIEMATRMTGSGFKKTLNELPLDSKVEITSITGNFILQNEIRRSFVFLAGGIGITPFMSMLKFIKEEVLPYKITFFYSNKDKETTPFMEELEKMASENIYLNLIMIMTEDPDWQGEKGRINEELLKKYLRDLNSYSYYIAGPPPFNEAVLDILKKENVDRKNIKVENFTGYKTIYGNKD